MIMGTCGLTFFISAATAAPDTRLNSQSSTTASTDSEMKSWRASDPLPAVTKSYPFSFNKLSWAGSRCMHSRVWLAAIEVMYISSASRLSEKLLNQRDGGTLRVGESQHSPSELYSQVVILESWDPGWGFTANATDYR